VFFEYFLVRLKLFSLSVNYFELRKTPSQFQYGRYIVIGNFFIDIFYFCCLFNFGDEGNTEIFGYFIPVASFIGNFWIPMISSHL
jgi:hypothetical protein